MKNGALTFFLLLLFTTASTQDMGYDVRGKYFKPITQEKLSNARTLSDINAGYASSWINDYVSVEIVSTSKGNERKVMGTNDQLNPEQRRLIAMADVGANIDVEVKYKYKNTVNANVDIRTANFTVTLIPDVEAEYPGGLFQLKKELKDQGIDKIVETFIKTRNQAVVSFTVSENGEATNAQMTLSSDDEKIDHILLELVNKMSKWKPAENAKGEKVKQEFELIVGTAFGC